MAPALEFSGGIVKMLTSSNFGKLQHQHFSKNNRELKKANFRKRQNN